MVALALQILGLSLGVIAWCLESSTTSSHSWKVRSPIGTVDQSDRHFEGLWTTCYSNSQGTVQCKKYNTVLGLPGYVQACRALMIIALVLGLVAIIAATLGLKCTNIGKSSPESKGKIALSSGIMFILSGVCTLTAVSWYADRIVKEFKDPFYGGIKFEFGAALYMGWAAACLAILGGTLLSFSFKKKAAGVKGGYAYNASNPSQGQKIYKQAPTSDSGSSKAYV